MNRKQKFERYSEEFYRGICHRGLHDRAKTENGMNAFKAAVERKMAFELDIHLTKDGRLLVHHDSELERVTGKKGIIEELTFDEIRSDYRLLDGEMIPSFQEVLDMNRERSLIVVELKVYKGNYRALRKAAMKSLEQIIDPKKIVLISFDPRALLGIGHRFQRELLVCKEHVWPLKFRFLYDSIDLDIALVKRPEVIRYRKKGGIVNVWTIESPEQLRDVSPYVDGITFQLFDPSLVLEDRTRYLQGKTF